VSTQDTGVLTGGVVTGGVVVEALTGAVVVRTGAVVTGIDAVGEGTGGVEGAPARGAAAPPHPAVSRSATTGTSRPNRAGIPRP